METHCHPEKALSDGPQALLPSDFINVDQCLGIHAVLRSRIALRIRVLN